MTFFKWSLPRVPELWELTVSFLLLPDFFLSLSLALPPLSHRWASPDVEVIYSDYLSRRCAAEQKGFEINEHSDKSTSEKGVCYLIAPEIRHPAMPWLHPTFFPGIFHYFKTNELVCGDAKVSGTRRVRKGGITLIRRQENEINCQNQKHAAK